MYESPVKNLPNSLAGTATGLKFYINRLKKHSGFNVNIKLAYPFFVKWKTCVRSPNKYCTIISWCKVINMKFRVNSRLREVASENVMCKQTSDNIAKSPFIFNLFRNTPWVRARTLWETSKWCMHNSQQMFARDKRSKTRWMWWIMKNIHM